MTTQPYDGATQEQLRHPLVRELLGVHNMFRNELAAILQYVDELIAGQQRLEGPQITTRVQELIRAGAQYSHMLHMHLAYEETHVCPFLARFSR